MRKGTYGRFQRKKISRNYGQQKEQSRSSQQRRRFRSWREKRAKNITAE